MSKSPGRPRNERPEHDFGTPELQAKRAAGTTTEALDLCLTLGYLTHEQHWCGVHFRWLHTLRFGAPGMRAVDTTSIGGYALKQESTDWRAAREEEYQHALHLLGPLASALLNMCVYNERPVSTQARGDISKALDILIKCWCRKGKFK